LMLRFSLSNYHDVHMIFHLSVLHQSTLGQAYEAINMIIHTMLIHDPIKLVHTPTSLDIPCTLTPHLYILNCSHQFISPLTSFKHYHFFCFLTHGFTLFISSAFSRSITEHVALSEVMRMLPFFQGGHM
jgi:hypothetical protein